MHMDWYLAMNLSAVLCLQSSFLSGIMPSKFSSPQSLSQLSKDTGLCLDFFSLHHGLKIISVVKLE